MPEVIAGWAASAFSGAAVTSFSSAAAVSAGTAAVYATAYVATAAGISAGVSSYQRQQTKKAMRALGGSTNLDPGRMVSVRDPAPSRKLVYGQMRVGGTIVFMAASGTNKEYFHLVIAHADHECEEIGDIYLSDEVVPLDGSGNATGKYAGYVTVKKHLGDDAQSVDTDLQTAVTAAVWSNDHRLRGVCYSYVRLKYNQDLFPSGLPNFSALIKGRKVFDPRTATTAWSANPALCLRDYLLLSADRGGLGAEPDEIDNDAVITAANICDEQVALA